MATLDWTNPYWSRVPYTASYTISQPTDPTKFKLERNRSDGVTTDLGDGFPSLADAQAAAQADCTKNCLF